MDTIEAMRIVFDCLSEGDCVAAQTAVMEIEKAHSVLPSSVFERVLRAAVAAGELTEAYGEWCMRAYGRSQFVELMASAVG